MKPIYQKIQNTQKQKRDKSELIKADPFAPPLQAAR